jgi:hypothetical protein
MDFKFKLRMVTWKSKFRILDTRECHRSSRKGPTASKVEVGRIRGRDGSHWGVSECLDGIKARTSVSSGNVPSRGGVRKYERRLHSFLGLQPRLARPRRINKGFCNLVKPNS